MNRKVGKYYGFRFVAFLGNVWSECIENVQMMSKPTRYLDDGTPVYLNRLGDEYINGEKIVLKWVKRLDGSIKHQKVGQRSGRIYWDEDSVREKRLNELDEINMQDALKRGKLAYMKYDPIRKKELTCEISTGKFIAELEGRKDGTYWKYYLSPDVDFDHCHMRTEGDPGIQITKEEFDKLNIYYGSHSAYDCNRTEHQYYRHCGNTRW